MVETSSDTAARPTHAGRGYLEVVAEHVRRQHDVMPLWRIKPLERGFHIQGMTYGELASSAQAHAAFFRAHGVQPGDRVVMSLSEAQRLLPAILGLMSMGAIAVPLQARSEFRTAELYRERMNRVCEDCRPRLILVEDLERWGVSMQGELPDAQALVARLAPGSVRELAFDPGSPDAPAIIQYTSGSTGAPRGVVLTHANVAANVRAIGEGTQSTSRDRIVSWLPLHHDMGLISMLMGLYWNAPYHVLSPVEFLLRPIVWLRAISAFGATQSVAPTFAYSLCWRKIPEAQLAGLDLSTWRVAYCGAEPIDPAVARGFCERFAPYGFRETSFFPVYGLAETTLAATFPPVETKPVYDCVERDALATGKAVPASDNAGGAVTFVSVGQAFGGHAVEVRDPQTDAPCLERFVGEVVVRGPSVSPRYYHEAPTSCRAELRTGDLGYLAAGRLFVIDRIKDLIIVRGANFAPADLERCAAEVPGLRRGRVVAFALPGHEGTEAVHFVAELNPRGWRTQAAIAQEVRQRILVHVGLEVSGLALVAPGSIPRTSSGKVRRRACRDLYVAGSFPARLSLWRRMSMRWRLVVGLARQALARRSVADGA